MAEIYDNVNLISFVDNTEMSLRDDEPVKHAIDMENQSHTLMNQRIMKQVIPDQLKSFLESADMVKFAGVTAMPEMADGATESARTYLKNDSASPEAARKEAVE